MVPHLHLAAPDWRTIRCGVDAEWRCGTQIRFQNPVHLRHIPQTFSSSVNVHRHVRAIVSRGGWTKDGTSVPIPYVDAGAPARLFRHKVLRP